MSPNWTEGKQTFLRKQFEVTRHRVARPSLQDHINTLANLERIHL
jgi:hypothetical protein